jgi:uncharacterized protein YjbK
MIPVEIELKWALSADGHARLAGRLEELLGAGLVLEQVNRFYDSADGRLRAARRSVRLRRENARVVLTCKGRGTVDALGTHRHDEWEREVPASAWEQTPADLPAAWQAALAGAPLIALGGFANRRQEWHDGPHLLCLDRSDFGASIDHELEIETPQPQAAHARWAGLLATWGISWTPQPITKLQRWIELRSRSSTRR